MISEEKEQCINRQEAIDAFQIFREYESNRSSGEWVDRIETVLNHLPPVTPQPKTGHWIYDYTTADGHRTYHCSECGCFLKPKHSEPLNSFKWCSLCGTKMQEIEE